MEDLDGIPEQEGDRILKACKRLETNPSPDGKHIKKLQGYQNLYRLRVGDYRVLFQLDDTLISVVRILTRQDFGHKV